LFRPPAVVDETPTPVLPCAVAFGHATGGETQAMRKSPRDAAAVQWSVSESMIRPVRLPTATPPTPWRAATTISTDLDGSSSTRRTFRAAA
jgi:hypothetical protein